MKEANNNIAERNNLFPWWNTFFSGYEIWNGGRNKTLQDAVGVAMVF